MYRDKKQRNKDYRTMVEEGISPSNWPYNMTAEEKYAHPNNVIKRQQEFIFNRA